MKNFYHLFANGNDARNFIVSESDYIYQFNLIGISALCSHTTVAAFSLEDTHLHALLYGSFDECANFKHKYETSTTHHIAASRGSKDNVVLDCSLYLIEDERYLMNAACYIIIQPTKDGKKIMPYDYRWGTGSMYFRPKSHVPIWLVRDDGTLIVPRLFGDLNAREQRGIANQNRSLIPGDWMVADGLILPSNFVDADLFESIFKTPNCFRVFMASGKNSTDTVLDEMAHIRGVRLEDSEARQLSIGVCKNLFGKESARHLSVPQRVRLGRELVRKYRVSLRQASTLSRVPEDELVKYL